MIQGRALLRLTSEGKCLKWSFLKKVNPGMVTFKMIVFGMVTFEMVIFEMVIL